MIAISYISEKSLLHLFIIQKLTGLQYVIIRNKLKITMCMEKELQLT